MEKSSKMADKHSLNYDVRELKLGASFTNNKTSQYHTIKYDFKPASVDVNKMASVDVGTNNQVTVTVPHLDGAGVPQTVFKGSQRPYTKECVLIIDRVTGEITLEKLSSNIQVKKTRQESAQKPRPLTPVTTDFTNTTQRSTSRTRVATNKRTQQPNPGFASGASAANGPAGPQARYNGAAPTKPPGMVRSPPRVKTSPPQAAPWSGGGNSTLASLPMIGLDDLAGPAPPPRDRVERTDRQRDPAVDRAVASLPILGNDRMNEMERLPERLPERMPERLPERLPERQPERQPERFMQREPAPAPAPAPVPVPVARPPAQEDSSSSSSSDSDSDSGSGSDSDDHDATQVPLPNGNISNPALPSDVLNDDLCLSESGSESD